MKTGLEEFNEFIEQLFRYWDGQVTEDDLCRNPFFGVSKEVDEEMQKDRFY